MTSLRSHSPLITTLDRFGWTNHSLSFTGHTTLMMFNTISPLDLHLQMLLYEGPSHIMSNNKESLTSSLWSNYTNN